MEIERKFTITQLPELAGVKYHEIEQAYLNTEPVMRIRKQDDDYYFTYKSSGLMAREEYNLAIDKKSFEHLIKKADGRIIKKTRYLIPYESYTIELDIFEGELAPLIIAEVEFASEEEAEKFVGPDWFDKDVTSDPRYHNSNMI